VNSLLTFDWPLLYYYYYYYILMPFQGNELKSHNLVILPEVERLFKLAANGRIFSRNLL